MHKVLLINRAMGHGSPATLVQGWHGEQLGTSRFNPAYSCHTIEISVDEYNKVAESLSRASHIAMRLWEPHFVPDPEMKAMAEFAAESDTRIPEIGPTVTTEESDPLETAPFFKLRKIAKEEGVDIDACETNEQIRAAIRVHRELVPA